MKYLRNILISISLTSVLFLSACSTVTIPYPLSANPKPIDKEKFEGVWDGGEPTVHVRFGSNGIAQIAWLDWADNEFQIVRAEMIVTEGDENNFLSFRMEEDGKWTNTYVFCQYSFSDNGELIVWNPNTETFEKAIEKGLLQGEVESGITGTTIAITNAPGKLLEFINDPENLKLFEYRKPVILRKIVGVEKNEKKAEE